jgi:hypothetical protein
MKSLDLFLPKIHQFAPGVGDPVAYEWIREAAITFCERTRSWRSFDTYNVNGIYPGDVRAPAGAVIHEIEQVTYNDQQLEAKSPEELDLLTPGWRSGAARGCPAYFTQLDPNTVAVSPLAAGRVVAWLILKPAADAMALPDFIADQYRQAIADGALMRILALPGKEWTNLQLASGAGAAFSQRLTVLSNKGSSGQQRAHPRSKSTFF